MKDQKLLSGDTDVTLLHLEDYVAAGETYYVGRRTEAVRFVGRLHTHDDFAELTWIEYGVLQHVVGGTRRLLEAGDVVFIRPDDVHLFRPVPGRSFAQVAVSFPSETLRALEARYFDPADWAWSAGGLPTTHRLDSVRLQRLTELSSVLVSGPAGRLQLERFLLELLCDLIGRPAGDGLPLWLTEALSRFADDPVALTEGVTGLAGLAGRSREHVNRVIQAGTGQTATEMVNQVRLNRAAAMLRMTDRPISAVAADCGFPSLSHFYRLFNDRFKATPRHYRMVSTVSGLRPLGSSR
ncbi:AraC family transcriptional regulator [Kribbella pittospori]|uniref:AraC family transcriptional regulator n=1 Tax=Kribbella pittospori TaxID=722689 RepID=A0A4R0JJ05_9ACTN|nr:helix-turn-helix domain-containing protein [Kribbella pittospori]TCC46991.1 AraC family transcriptional regulator [Kribbella pittospori]